MSEPRFLVVGTTQDGERCILAQKQTREDAAILCAQFRALLEGYRRIQVEVGNWRVQR